MPLDPQLANLLTMLSAMGAPPLSQGTAVAARAGFDAMTTGMRQPEMLVPVAGVTDGTYEGAGSLLALRVYRPVEAPHAGDTTVPTVLFIHGGGFVIGSIDTHDNQARAICAGVGAVVVSIEYRLAPEAPFPAALEDCVAALEWVTAHVEELGGDPSRIAVGGDSAGGNLSAVLAQTARDRGIPLAAQLLIYPGVDFDEHADYPSRVDNAAGYLLTTDDMTWFGQQYITAGTDPDDPRLSPLRAADLSGLAPAVLVTAEFDPLRDEGEAYADALEAAGVAVRRHRFDGMIHGFFDLGVLSPAAAAAVKVTCDDLKAALAEPAAHVGS